MSRIRSAAVDAVSGQGHIGAAFDPFPSAVPAEEGHAAQCALARAGVGQFGRIKHPAVRAIFAIHDDQAEAAGQLIDREKFLL